MRLAVAGGTGWIGRLVVATAEAAGHDAVSISRSTGVDLTTGTGLEAAVRGADAVIDVSNASGIGRRSSVGFFEPATRNLLAAEGAAGVRHHVALSIVGIDRVPFGYYEGKRRQEALIAGGEVPWTVLRATQFHEFAAQMLEYAVGPFVPVPKMRSATVAAQEVAEQLVTLAAGPPGGQAAEMSGPEVHDLPTLVRRLLAARRRCGWVVPIRMPGAAGKAMTGDGLLPAEGGVVGRRTFDEWLTDQTVTR